MELDVVRDRRLSVPEFEAASERMSSGNPEADHILGGGFPKDSINIIMGHPGSGKTIFAEQLIFANADDDRPILYLTTLSEPLPKVVRYLQGFRFFDESKLGSQVIYEDVGPELARDGSAALIPLLQTAIRELSPKIIVIDSFKAVHDLLPSVGARRRMVYEMTALLTAYGTTAFLLGEYNEEDILRYPEFAVADGIVEMSRRRLGNRDERYFRVYKLRGSRYLEGAHAFRITDSGLDIFPRLVSPQMPEGYEPASERISTGITGLDEMLDGGVWRGSTTLLGGPSGAGKTTIALQFALEGARQGEPTLYMNFQENPSQLMRTIRNLGVNLEGAQAQGLDLVYASPVELQIDSIIVDMFRRIQQRRVRRLVIDALGDLASAATDPQRLHDYLYALVQHFAVSGITSVLNFETTGNTIAGNGVQNAVSYLSDNVLLLTVEGEERTRRSLRILKTRGSAHDARVREVEISPTGLRVL
ncbi:MAG TPA: ATPase domain-containing protein [Gemmatimonadaceae bacterium]|nr:ATPase domain-containing protein [Gemmatimonadaceae bacterium]